MTVKWSTRIFEGILIGLGASVVLGLYGTMSDAVDSLKTATRQLESQNSNNKEFSRLIELGAKEDQIIRNYISDELSKINGSLNQIVLRIETLDKKSSGIKSTTPSALQWDSKLWENLKSNKSSTPTIPPADPTTPWTESNESKLKLFQNLNKSIELQEKLSIK